ncbi:MAG TPA: carboxymuconolactone decarboxylase family protein [Burkholderiales bacterium]|nr:carboxymuconolactone decarboxylase family protein [Burkholderiales bacterium]
MANSQQEVRYNLAPVRLGPIAEDQMTDAQKAAVAAVMSGPRKHMGGPFSALLRSPELMNRVQKVGEYLRFQCPLDKRLGEFAAIIAARHWSQQFEWWAHYKQAIEAGLKAEIGDAVAEGRRPTGMAEDEEILYDFLTEALNNKGVSDTTYARAVKKFGEQSVIDILAVAGYYGLLALVMNVARTPVPEGHALPLTALPVRATPISP